MRERWTFTHRPEEIGMMIYFDGQPMFYQQWFGEERAQREVARLNARYPGGLPNQ